MSRLGALGAHEAALPAGPGRLRFSKGHKHLDAARTASCMACSPPLQQEGACHTDHQGTARHCQVRHAQVHGAREAGQRGRLQHCHHAARHPGRWERMQRDASPWSQQSTASAAVNQSNPCTALIYAMHVCEPAKSMPPGSGKLCSDCYRLPGCRPELAVRCNEAASLQSSA